jgi:hypothetical protein
MKRGDFAALVDGKSLNSSVRPIWLIKRTVKSMESKCELLC